MALGATTTTENDNDCGTERGEPASCTCDAYNVLHRAGAATNPYGRSMRILIIGGTRFVGRHMAEAAVDRGHEVTLFHRGLH